MFAQHRTDREPPRPSAEMLRVLREAGCDTTDEGNVQIGMVCYGVAQQVWERRHKHLKAARPAQKSTAKSSAGRNDPCPCGSGKKYKKCCLDKDRADSGGGQTPAASKFDPAILPRIWDESAVSEDLGILSEIMDREPALAKIGFSKEKVLAFLETVTRENPSVFDNDKEALEAAIDDLAFRYATESGEWKIIKGIHDKFFAAASSARSNDEMRALATGICMAFMGEAAGDADANVLAAVFFRRAMFEAGQGASLFGKVFDQLGGDPEKIRRQIETNDPALREKIEACMKDLSASELEVMETAFDRNRDALWDTISSDEFPVPMPFATQLAFLFRLAGMRANKANPSPEAMTKLLETFSDELIEEDHILYMRMLERWLANCENRSGHVAKAVETLIGMCVIRSLGEFAPSLLIRGCRRGLFVPFDAAEQHFIDRSSESFEDPEFIAEYGAWLTSKGYPGLADRLLASCENHVRSRSPDPDQAQKSGSG